MGRLAMYDPGDDRVLCLSFRVVNGLQWDV